MTGTVRPHPARLLLALSGWLALLTTLLPAADPVRTTVTAAFLLLGPGTAALLAAPARARSANWPDRLATVALALALSAAIVTLVAVAFFLAHLFTLGRAMAVLALLTSLLALLPGRRGRQDGGGPPLPATDEPPVTVADPRRRGRLGRRSAVVAGSCVLLLTAACAGPAASHGLTVVPQAAEATATGAAASATPAAPGAWHQVFRDDFNGLGLDPANWVTCYDWNDAGCTNAGNHEEQWYLPGQVAVNGGALVLSAERTPTAGSDGKSYPWTSGMVSTGRQSWDGTPLHTFTYGYFAAAIRTPQDPRGMFPAFWLIPAETRGAPPELDVAEFPGTDRFVAMNLHWRTADGGDGSVGHRYTPQRVSAGSTVFAMDWEPDSVTWYVDGVQQFRVTDPAVIPSVAMELILNLAVGYPQSPPSDVGSAQLHVDWVAVWQH